MQGKSLAQNYDLAFTWLDALGQQNIPESGYMLAMLYALREDIKQNKKKSIELLKKAADLGLGEAQYQYAGLWLILR